MSTPSLGVIVKCIAPRRVEAIPDALTAQASEIEAGLAAAAAEGD